MHKRPTAPVENGPSRHDGMIEMFDAGGDFRDKMSVRLLLDGRHGGGARREECRVLLPEP